MSDNWSLFPVLHRKPCCMTIGSFRCRVVFQDVYSFTLPGHQYEYHTKLRPNARKFLESIGKFFELHIFTMGSRMYAHTVAKCLDPDGKFFAHRIRSRDEFINSFSKFHDLKYVYIAYCFNLVGSEKFSFLRYEEDLEI